MKTKQIIAKTGLLIMIMWVIYSTIYTPIVDFFPIAGYWIIPIVILAWIGWIVVISLIILFTTWAINTLTK